MKLIETLRQRQLRIRRNIEAARLRRIRRHTRPGYTHCMNCGTRLKGMYCHQCGQYALDIHQPIWKYIRQYFENMYQFDGKIWMTLRLMFTRPGFLTNEFNDGKINSYVHPFRLYMCISVVFFTLFFMAAERATDRALLSIAGEQIPDTVMAALSREDADALPDTTVYAYNTETLFQVLDARGARQADSLVRPHYGDRGDELNLVTLPRLLFDSCLTRTAVHEETQTEVGVLRRTARLGTPDEEERFYLDLPVDTLTGRITADTYDWTTRLDPADQLHQQVTASFVLGQLSKWTPLFLMFLLPVQALLFKLFYRSRRYMEHFAHATHLSSLLLVLLVAPAAILLWHFNAERYADVVTNTVEDAIIFLTPLALLAYQLVSMHTVYREGWGKTTAKCLLMLFLFNLLALGTAAGLIAWLAAKAMGRV